MSYLILSLSLLSVFFLIFSKNIFYKYSREFSPRIKKSLNAMLKLTIIAPVIVLLVIITLTLTYLKTKFDIRLSHAWLVLSFWICDVIFYYIFAGLVRTGKSQIIPPIIGMIISTCVAIYLTPLSQYESAFRNISIIIPNVFGLIMLITAYYINYILQRKEIRE
jgi:hypothetical protein